MVVVGVLVAWWVDRRKQRELLKRLVDGYGVLEAATNAVVERLPNGGYDVWTGPRKQAEGAFAYPKRQSPADFP
jgi:hypothetical protein